MARIIVGRMDNNRTVEIPDRATILSAMEQNGFHKADNEVIQDLNGVEYSGDEEVVGGKSYFLVQRLKSGLNSSKNI